MSEGELYTGGMRRFQREGYPTPKGVELPHKNFQEKLEELRAGDAAEIARKYHFGEVITQLLETHDIEDLTPEVCEKFIYENQKFSGYHPALVRAVAEEITKEKRAREAMNNTRH